MVMKMITIFIVMIATGINLLAVQTVMRGNLIVVLWFWRQISDTNNHVQQFVSFLLYLIMYVVIMTSE